MSTFRLTMYPARDGDCLVLTWGHGTLHHLVMDLGRSVTYESVRPALAELGEVELLVISHIDADHIGGAMPLVRESAPPFTPKRVWFNAREQLLVAQNRTRPIEPFSTRQGDKLSQGITALRWPWNAEFASEVVSTGSLEASDVIELAGGLGIRLLSPDDAALTALLPTWKATVKDEHAYPGDPDPVDEEVAGPTLERFGGLPNVTTLAGSRYVADDTLPNGSSIAFVAEFDDKRVLLAADAHAEVLGRTLRPLADVEGGRVQIDLAKLGHHGSRRNTSNELLELIDCSQFAFSTDGVRHGHPDPETVARLLAAEPTRDKMLWFNYRQPNSEMWEVPALASKWRYRPEMPTVTTEDAGNGTIVIDI